MKWIVLWGLFAIAGMLIAGILASLKNRDYSFWMGWCFLFPPLVIVLLFLPRYPGKRPRQRSFDEDDRAEERLL